MKKSKAETVKTWEEVHPEIRDLASSGQLVPFLGAAISHFQPTNLPLGKGLLRAALQGIFPDKPLFKPMPYHAADDLHSAEGHLFKKEEDFSDVERAIDSHSAEVVLQGLAEALPTRDKLADLYNAMCRLPPNPLHYLMAAALATNKVPAVFTTNQDRCLEDAAISLSPIYDEADFAHGLHCNLFQFHGAIGGEPIRETANRRQSLSFTLNSMGPELPVAKNQILREALSRFSLLFIGYSGSDPDIWYSLDRLLAEKSNAHLYWCVRGEVNGHISRLQEKHCNSITVFDGDLRSVLQDLSNAWNVHLLDLVKTPTLDQQKERLDRLRSWSLGLTTEQRELTYGWLLDSVGLHRQAAENLESLLSVTHDRQVHMLSSLFAGYARREIGEHVVARRHLQVTIDESANLDPCRYAQAAQKLGESLAAFESVRFWQWLPTIRKLHAGADWLGKAISVYETLPPEELTSKQLGRAGLGSAKMNLGQLYRRVAAFTPGVRSGLANYARELIDNAMQILKDQEKDLRSLPMALAAVAADSPTISLDEKETAINEAIEYSEQWNQDQIQIGSAYFAKARLFARNKPDISESCYQRALAAFRAAEMNAEIARAELELAFVLSIEARRTISNTQGSSEWKFGLRVLGVLKVISALALKEATIAVTAVILLFVMILFWGIWK